MNFSLLFLAIFKPSFFQFSGNKRFYFLSNLDCFPLKMINAFKYFSTHCCMWKQTASVTGESVSISSFPIFKSFSALAIHFLTVSSFSSPSKCGLKEESKDERYTHDCGRVNPGIILSGCLISMAIHFFRH